MVYLVTVLYIAVDRYYYGATMKGNVLMFAHNCLCTTTSPLYPLRLILLLVFVVINVALLFYNLSSSIMVSATSCYQCKYIDVDNPKTVCQGVVPPAGLCKGPCFITVDHSCSLSISFTVI